MNLVKVSTRQIFTNYKHESKVEYMESYINLDKVTHVLIMGSVARVKFSGTEGDYVQIDTGEWDKVAGF